MLKDTSLLRKIEEFVVIDIESDGLSPHKGGMMIEIAVIKIKNNKIIDKRSQLINPERKIAKKTTEITNITNEMLEGKPTFSEVMPGVHSFIGDLPVVGYNVSFDWRYLDYFFKKIGIYAENELIDLMKVAKKTYKGLDNYKLINVCKYKGIEINNAHRALDDTLATAKLFFALREDNKREPSLFDDIVEEKKEKIEPKKQEILNISMWEKEIRKKKMKRLYVNLERSVVFYDFNSNSWLVKSSNEPIDFLDIEKRVLERYKKTSMKNIS